MARSVRVRFKPSLFERQTVLQLEPDHIAYGAANYSKLEVAGLRYGVKGIRGFYLRIGRIYCVDIKAVSGAVIKIRLKSLYGINRVQLGKKYKQIVDAAVDNYMTDIARDHIRQFHRKMDFDLLGNVFTQDGIVLDRTEAVVPWGDLGTRNFHRYYALFSKADPGIYRTFNYLDDWNTCVLYSVSRSILKSKRLL